MKQATLKLLVFLTALIAIILAIKGISNRPGGISHRTNFPKQTQINKDTTFYFIGSSRVRSGVAPNIIEPHFENTNVVNLGIIGGTFLSNCIVADHIIQQEGDKVLFIELSPLQDNVPSGLSTFASKYEINLLASIFRITTHFSLSEKAVMLGNIVNQRIFSTISLTHDIQSIISFDEIQKERRAGLASSNAGNDRYGVSSFLTFNEIEGVSYNTNLLSKYHQTISFLKNLADQHQAQLIFFLPITFNKQAERDIVIPLYNTLPDEMKLEYTKHFLDQMAHSKYLQNRNHLNQQGAEAFSQMIVPFIKNKTEEN